MWDCWHRLLNPKKCKLAKINIFRPKNDFFDENCCESRDSGELGELEELEELADEQRTLVIGDHFCALDDEYEQLQMVDQKFRGDTQRLRSGRIFLLLIMILCILFQKPGWCEDKKL
jgi:UDP-2,3-diacylglucosamine pyrophosphatase LpxH